MEEFSDSNIILPEQDMTLNLVSVPEEIKVLMLKVVSEAKDTSLKKREVNSLGQTDGEEDSESITSKMFKSKFTSPYGV